MERFVDRIAKHNLNRTREECIEISEERRIAFRMWHARSCDGSAERCDPDYLWCTNWRMMTNHVYLCVENCSAQCEHYKQLIQHLSTCRDNSCDLCPYRYFDIENTRSEDEADEESGDSVIRYDLGDPDAVNPDGSEEET